MLRYGALIVGLIISVSTGHSRAEITDFSFRDRRMGDSLDSMRQLFKNRPQCYSEAEWPGVKFCYDETLSSTAYGPKMIGDLRVESLVWTFLDDRLVEIYLKVKEQHFNQLRQMVVGRYGTPDSAEIIEFKTRGGAVYNGAEPGLSSRDVFRTCEIVMAARESAERGRTVKI